MTAETIIAQIRDLEPNEVEKVAAFFRNDAKFRNIVDKVIKESAPSFHKLAKRERENEPVKK